MTLGDVGLIRCVGNRGSGEKGLYSDRAGSQR